jgi:hypothetical protein
LSAGTGPITYVVATDADGHTSCSLRWRAPHHEAQFPAIRLALAVKPLDGQEATRIDVSSKVTAQLVCP